MVAFIFYEEENEMMTENPIKKRCFIFLSKKSGLDDLYCLTLAVFQYTHIH